MSFSIRVLTTSLCLLALASTSATAQEPVHAKVIEAQQARIAAIAKAKKASISVFANGGRGGGSGVVVTPDGYALTNYHVVKPCGNYMQCSMPDGVLYDAVIVGIDAVGDVALIKLLGRDDFPTATMADSDKVQPGDWCFAIGNPFLLATDFQPTVTYGIVSGTHRYQYPAGTLLEYADCIQTDASINPGNSGGPLFNADGDLIGINGRGSFEKRGRVNVGVGYAISINQIKHFMGYLRSGRIVDHATLGATVSSDDAGNVVVTNIIESSDAYRRGLRYGDQIVSFGGRTIGTANAFKNVLGIYPKGWRVPLTYRREGETFDTFVRLSGVHSTEQLLEKLQGKAPGEEEEQPMPGKPEEKPEDDATSFTQMQLPGGGAGIPPAAAKLIEERRGYANYYFNKLNRDRIADALAASGDFRSVAGAWNFNLVQGGDKFQIEVTDDAVKAIMPRGQAIVKMDQNLETQTGPDGSGGLLLATYIWKRLLTTEITKFGDVYYVGTCPTPVHTTPQDVLMTTHRVVETRFYFDPDKGHLSYMEMYPDVDVDPCEIHFDDYREVDGRMLPHRWEVRWGDQEFGVFELQDVKFAAKS